MHGRSLLYSALKPVLFQYGDDDDVADDDDINLQPLSRYQLVSPLPNPYSTTIQPLLNHYRTTTQALYDHYATTTNHWLIAAQQAFKHY